MLGTLTVLFVWVIANRIFDGRIAFAGDGQGYGNVVKIDHGGGKATAYAHMSRFADGIKVGVDVKAGDVIGCEVPGYSGTGGGPSFDGAYLNAGSMTGPTAIGNAGQNPGGELWRQVK